MGVPNSVSRQPLYAGREHGGLEIQSVVIELGIITATTETILAVTPGNEGHQNTAAWWLQLIENRNQRTSEDSNLVTITNDLAGWGIYLRDMRHKTTARIMTNLAAQAHRRLGSADARNYRPTRTWPHQEWTEPYRDKDHKQGLQWSEFSILATWLRHQYKEHRERRRAQMEQNTEEVWRRRLEEEGLQQTDLPCSMAEIVHAVGQAEAQARADEIMEYTMMGKEVPLAHPSGTVEEDFAVDGSDPMAEKIDEDGQNHRRGITAGDGSAWKDSEHGSYTAGVAAGGSNDATHRTFSHKPPTGTPQWNMEDPLTEHDGD